MRGMIFLVACCTAVSVDLPHTTAADFDWPGWLGRNRDGWVGDFTPPADWPQELDRGWSAEVGTGYGSPLVSGDRVYQHARQGEDEVVWCLDLDTGEIKWRKHYATPFKIGGGGEFHGKGPKSSPILSDGRVITLSITGVLSAWDAETGDELWRRDFGPKFKKQQLYWGASTSPIVDGDRVIAHFGTDGEGTLIALDTESGKEVWTQGNDGPSYSSPLVVEIGGVRQIIDWNQRVLAGIEITSGTRLWEYPFPREEFNQNMPTPTFYDGRLFIGAENRGVRCVEPERVDGKWTARQVWFQKAVAHDMSSAVINEGMLFGFSHYGRGRIYCLDIANGDVLWQGPGRSGQNATFLAVPGQVMALLDSGQLRVIQATGEAYKEIASYRVSENPTWAPPVVLEDGFLIKDIDTLTRWSLKKAAGE